MKKECSSCHGTGKCPECKGTGRFGYPGDGQVDLYRTSCIACQGSGDCRACRGHRAEVKAAGRSRCSGAAP